MVPGLGDARSERCVVAFWYFRASLLWEGECTFWLGCGFVVWCFVVLDRGAGLVMSGKKQEGRGVILRWVWEDSGRKGGPKP